MHKSLLPAFALLGIVVATALRPLPQEEDDLKAQVAALQKALKVQEAGLLAHERALKESHDRLASVESWFRNLPAAVMALETGVSEAEQQGFTNAGANPRAREALLSGLRNLATGLKANVPTPKAAKEK